LRQASAISRGGPPPISTSTEDQVSAESADQVVDRQAEDFAHEIVERQIDRVNIASGQLEQVSQQPGFARIIRGMVSSLREYEYVEDDRRRSRCRY
jgi:hypothetical protein